MKKALVIGVDEYSTLNQLSGCVNDAVEIAALLKTNEGGSPNFDVIRIISEEGDVTSSNLLNAVKDLFAGPAETALLYFAGHGIFDPTTNGGFLVAYDGKEPNWGLSLNTVLELANKAYPRIKSTVILLDSCQSGFMGQVTGMGNDSVSMIGNGVTLLTACHKEETAEEALGGHGKFTNILLDGLRGAAGDVLGRVTPAALYAHVDQTLGAWEQRPLYKANVQSFITLREVAPKVPVEILRRLVAYFPVPEHVFRLDPSYEPDRGEETTRLQGIPIVDGNVRIYRELQKCNRHGLITPTEHEHMWHSAVHSGGCKLTATGVHYRQLAEKKRI